jgi:hypothetical protein
MDKFVKTMPDGARYVVKKNKYNDDDSRSISENINNSLILKGNLPTLKSGSNAHSSKKQDTETSNPIDDLLEKIDCMEEKFEESECSVNIDEIDFEDFKKNVKSWINFDNSLLQLDKERKELLKKRNEFNEQIIKFMKKYDVDDIKIDEIEKLKFDVRNRTCGYTKKTLQENVYQYFTQNKEVADKLLVYLETSRKIKPSENLKRVKNK